MCTQIRSLACRAGAHRNSCHSALQLRGGRCCCRGGVAAVAAAGAVAAGGRAIVAAAAGVEKCLLLLIQGDEILADVLLGLPGVGVAVLPPAKAGRCRRSGQGDARGAG